MTRAKDTVEGYLWNHAGKVLEYLLLFSTTVLIARGLGVEANGAFAALVSSAQLLIVLSSLSLESSLNRFIPQLEASDPKTAGARLRFLLRRVFVMRGALLTAIVGLALIFLQFSGLRLPEAAARYFWLLAAYAVLRSFVQLLSMVYVAQLRTASLARIAVAVRVAELTGVAAMLVTGMTVGSVMMLFVTTGALQVAACLYVGRSDFSGEVEPYSLRPVYAFGALYWTNTILEYFLGRQGDILFLTTILPTPVPASMYNVAFSTVLVVTQGLTLGLGGITLTSFSRLAVTSSERMDHFYVFLVRLISLMVIPALIFVFFFAGPIVTVLFSHEFAGAAILIQGMVIFRVAARLFAGSENAEYLLAKGHTVSVVKIGIIGAAANIILDVLLIPRYLAFGAVIGSGCANLLVNILGYLYVRRTVGHPVIQWSFWALTVITAIAAGVVTVYVLPGGGWAWLLGRGAAFAACTLFFLYCVKPFRSRDIAWVMEINESMARVLSRFARHHADTAMQVS